MTQYLAKFGALDSEIIQFLDHAISETKPKWIVTAERKGTALMRCYTDRLSGETETTAIWDKVLSSQSLESVPSEDLQGGTILVIDEGVYSGRGLSQTVRRLVDDKHVANDQIRLAVFGVHERSLTTPDYRWFGQLSEDGYREMRANVVHYFQRRGSLLLDTEHVEVGIDLNCGRLEFFDALCRVGAGVQHVSAAGRVNLTISEPLYLDEADLALRLPAGTMLASGIRKIRVVERAPDRFAILPIFFPAIPSILVDADLQRLDPCFAGQLGAAKKNFMLFGLYSAITLFATLFAGLRELIADGKIRSSIPAPGASGDAISHLGSLFHGLDLNAVHAMLESSVEKGRNRRLKSRDLCPSVRLDAIAGSRIGDRLEELTGQILSAVVQFSDRMPGRPFGPTVPELRKLIDLDITDFRERALFSAALDQLIDSARLVPDADELPFADGITRIARTFRPDSEMVSAEVRRKVAMTRGSMDLDARAAASIA